MGMKIKWDEDKNEWLQENRLISFEEIMGMLLRGEYLDIVENPARDNQMYFVLLIQGYTWLAPFVIEESDGLIFLKTAFPSRKYHKRYQEES